MKSSYKISIKEGGSGDPKWTDKFVIYQTARGTYSQKAKEKKYRMLGTGPLMLS